MIPQEQLHPQSVQMLGEYVYDEIHQALGERRPLEERWIEYHKAYRALPEQAIKTFPFYGSSNLVIPVAATDVDVIFARLMGILFAPDNVFSTRAKKPEMTQFAPVLQEFLQAVQDTELNTYNAVADWVLEILKLGTGILKTRYRREHKHVYEFRELGGQVYENVREIRLHDHPQFDHVSLFDFLLPATALDIQSSPWVGERILLTWQQFLNRVREGIYIAPPRIADFHAQERGSHVLEHMMGLDAFKAGRGNKIELWETWLNFDVKGIGEPCAVLGTFHLPTRSLVRLDYNPFLDQMPPHEAARFLRQEKRFYGIGMVEMLYGFQDEVTAMHNQRIDSGTLANSMVFKGRSGSVRDDEPIYPGRWFILDDLEDVQTMPLTAGKFDSSIQYEPMTMQYAKNRSGVNEYVAGQFAPSIGYATAHTNIQQAQMAVQRFDQTLREIRHALGNSGARAVSLYQQFDRPGKAYQILGQKDGEILQRFIQFPVDYIRDSVGIEVTATSASLNKETEIRTNTILMQMLTQFYSEVMNGLAVAFNPQVAEPIRQIVMQMIQGGSILMRRILDLHGVQDADDLVPHIRDIISGQLPIGQLSGENFNPGQGGTQGIDVQSQFPMLSGGLGGVGGGVPGGNGQGRFAGGNLPLAGGGQIL